MLRMLHRDLYDVELPHPNEIFKQIIVPMPELGMRSDVRRYLEFVVNRYDLNPAPKLTLFVEGPSEEHAVREILTRYFGSDAGVMAIEIIVLGGVDNATGTSEDRFRAIFRLVDYLHHHQTFAFVILDNERSEETEGREPSRQIAATSQALRDAAGISEGMASQLRVRQLLGDRDRRGAE